MVIVFLTEIDLTGHFSQCLEGGPITLRQGKCIGGRVVVLGIVGPVTAGSSRVARNAMEGQARINSLGFRDGRTVLGQMVCQRVDAALGKVLATFHTGMRISVTVVLELLASLKVREDDWIGLFELILVSNLRNIEYGGFSDIARGLK